MKIAILQLNSKIGDFEKNAVNILDGYRRAVAAGAELVVTPEMILPGYPPKDKINQPDFVRMNRHLLGAIAKHTGEIPLITGTFRSSHKNPGKPFYNGAAVMMDGGIKQFAYKTLLPTYGEFGEMRDFEPCEDPRKNIFIYRGKRIGLSFCEDIWNDKDHWSRRLYPTDPVDMLINEKIDVLINQSGSPWYMRKEKVRYDMLSRVARDGKVPLIYTNMVGGNDCLVFDGQSMAFNAQGQLTYHGPAFTEAVHIVDTEKDAPISMREAIKEENLFSALNLGLRDYVEKNGFSRLVLGLSGGIDSALAAVIAAEALGPERVIGVMMPSEFTSSESNIDAETLAHRLGINLCQVPIKPVFEAMKQTMSPLRSANRQNVTEENFQARIRGMILMGISNDNPGCMVLSTGNKSEMAVGYCTLYGDMCGGFAILNDVYKTEVFELSHWVNEHYYKKEVIPQNTLQRPPSAELSENQKDQDTLPPYEILDDILIAHLEEGKSMQQIIDRGHHPADVVWTLSRLESNEHKRKQAPPGLKVTRSGFNTERQYPLTAAITYSEERKKFPLDQMLATKAPRSNGKPFILR